MAQHTTRLNLNYPQSTDPANPPSDFQSLATTIDNEVVGYYQGSSTAAPSAPYEGMFWFQTDTMNIYYYSGAATGWQPVSMYFASSTATAPNPAVIGMFWYQTDTNKLLVYNGSQWIAPVPTSVSASSNPPTPAYTGMLWYQSDTKMMKVYDGTLGIPAWVTPSSLIYYNSAAPSGTIAQGALWFDTNSQIIKIYSGSSWQATSSNPPGTIIDYAGVPGGYSVPTGSTASTSQPLTTPIGYMVCDGAPVSRTTYANLYAAIGTTWGNGNGTSTFNIPDLRGKVTVGVGGQTSTNTKPAYSLAATDGEKTHQLSINEMPSHNHTINDPGHYHQIFGYSGWNTQYQGYGLGLLSSTNGGYNYNSNSAATNITINYTGGNAYHQNMQPSTATYKLIKY